MQFGKGFNDRGGRRTQITENKALEEFSDGVNNVKLKVDETKTR